MEDKHENKRVKQSGRESEGEEKILYLYSARNDRELGSVSKSLIEPFG